MAQTKALKQFACGVIDNIAQELHGISKEIWGNPELAFQEHKAHDLLTSYLEEKFGKVQRRYVCETGFRLTYGDGDGPHIAFLCEYDALPHIGHACGHNLIAELGIGAGVAILETLKSKGIGGKVTILGCPAEENGFGGKVKMIKAKVFDDVDVAMMAHPQQIYSMSPRGTYLANLHLYVTYKGKASHAAAFPWEGKNALDAAVMAYNSISCLRQQMRPGWRVSGIITNGGAKPNIIPEETSMDYCVRAKTLKELDEVTEKVKACLKSAATATDCEVEILDNRIHSCSTESYYDLISNKGIESAYIKNASEFGIILDEVVSLAHGSTDMGNVSHVVPSIHPRFSIGATAMNHTRVFTAMAGSDEAQAPTLTQAKVLAMTAIDIYCNKELLLKIKDEFAKDPNRID